MVATGTQQHPERWDLRGTPPQPLLRQRTITTQGRSRRPILRCTHSGSLRGRTRPALWGSVPKCGAVATRIKPSGSWLKRQTPGHGTGSGAGSLRSGRSPPAGRALETARETRIPPTTGDEGEGRGHQKAPPGSPRGLGTPNRPAARACSPGHPCYRRGPGPSSGRLAASRARGPPGAPLLRTGGAGSAASPTDLRPARPSARPPDAAGPDAEVSASPAPQPLGSSRQLSASRGSAAPVAPPCGPARRPAAGAREAPPRPAQDTPPDRPRPAQDTPPGRPRPAGRRPLRGEDSPSWGSLYRAGKGKAWQRDVGWIPRGTVLSVHRPLLHKKKETDCPESINK